MPTHSLNTQQKGEQFLGDGQEVDCALRLLKQANAYAADVGQDNWQFAVEIAQLRKIGISDSALRWLLCKGAIAHAEETTHRNDRYRTFQALGLFTLSDRTCFVLSSIQGVNGIASLTASEPSDATLCRTNCDETRPNSRVPFWDSVRHELRLGNVLVKRFKHRSPNQEAVLSAFQEDGWPFKVDDPLPQTEECDPKRRLSDTIRGLNHHQMDFLVRFRGDGTGEAVSWELVVREQLSDYPVRASVELEIKPRQDCSSSR